jgi:hypothetical protein
VAELFFIDDALDDLERFRRSGEYPRILKKLSQIEADPLNVGKPLGQALAIFRKLTFGDRQWRIIFHPDKDGSAATVWVIGDRDDMECYRIAKKRLSALGDSPHRAILAEAVATFDEAHARVSEATDA